MFSCSVLVSPTRDLKNHVRQDSMPERVDAKSKTVHRGYDTFSSTRTLRFWIRNPSPIQSQYPNRLARIGGPCCHISVWFLDSACSCWLAMKCFICVSVCRRVMKPVGEGFRAWSNPLLLLASLMGASVQACRLLAAQTQSHASPVQSAASRLEWRGK